MAAAKRATSPPGRARSPAARAPKGGRAAATKTAAGERKKAAQDGPAPGTFRPFEALKKRLPSKPVTPKRSAPPRPAAEVERAPLTFASAMRGVRPLDAGTMRVARSSDDDEAAATLRSSPAEPGRLGSLVMAGLTFEVIDDGATLQGRRIDVDPRELRRLRQAHYAIDGTLDLHKHTVSEARVAVVGFVARRAREGDKVVAIVHGKGKHSIGGESVLRGELGAWLSQGAAARHVHAFASVVDPSGESGMLLVRIG